MNPIQFVLIAFFVLAIFRVGIAVRSTQISWRRGLLWIALWIVACFVVSFPDTTMILARFSGVKRGVDAVLYITVAMLTYLVFRLYAAMEKQDQVITKLVSELALRELPALPTERRPDTS